MTTSTTAAPATQQATPDQNATPTDAGKGSTAPGQTEATPGQLQETPGAASTITPADTGTTPSGQTTGTAKADLTPVTPADIGKDAAVYDQDGVSVGKIESVTGKNAVLSTGKSRVTIPVSSLAKGDKGLVVGMSKEEIDAASKKAAPAKPTKKK